LPLVLLCSEEEGPCPLAQAAAGMLRPRAHATAAVTRPCQLVVGRAFWRQTAAMWPRCSACCSLLARLPIPANCHPCHRRRRPSSFRGRACRCPPTRVPAAMLSSQLRQRPAGMRRTVAVGLFLAPLRRPLFQVGARQSRQPHRLAPSAMEVRPGSPARVRWRVCRMSPARCCACGC